MHPLMMMAVWLVWTGDLAAHSKRLAVTMGWMVAGGDVVKFNARLLRCFLSYHWQSEKKMLAPAATMCVPLISK